MLSLLWTISFKICSYKKYFGWLLDFFFIYSPKGQYILIEEEDKLDWYKHCRVIPIHAFSNVPFHSTRCMIKNKTKTSNEVDSIRKSKSKSWVYLSAWITSSTGSTSRSSFTTDTRRSGLSTGSRRSWSSLKYKQFYQYISGFHVSWDRTCL